MNLRKLKLAFAIILGLTFTACSGDDGEQGPQGPAGKDGTANLSSETFTTTNSDWEFDAQSNSYEATINVPSITQDVIDRGTVQIFGVDGGTLTALPAASGVLQINFEVEIARVTIFISRIDGVLINNPGGVTFKLVVIPPADFIEGVDHKNFQMVSDIYGLEEFSSE